MAYAIFDFSSHLLYLGLDQAEGYLDDMAEIREGVVGADEPKLLTWKLALQQVEPLIERLLELVYLGSASAAFEAW